MADQGDAAGNINVTRPGPAAGRVAMLSIRPVTSGRPLSGHRSLLSDAQRPSAAVLKAADKLCRDPVASVSGRTEAIHQPQHPLLQALLVADGQGLLQGEIRTAAQQIGLAIKWGDTPPAGAVARVAEILPEVQQLIGGGGGAGEQRDLAVGGTDE